MITRVELLAWKGYDRLALDLGPGTTFLVAPNGVGKTSLVQAIAWGLLGDEHSGVDGEAARRGDETTRVRLTVQLPGGRTARVMRSLDPPSGRTRAKPVIEYDVDGLSGATPEAWIELLTQAWSAPAHLLGRLVAVSELAVWEEQSDPVGARIDVAVRQLLRLDALEATAKSARTKANRARSRVKETGAVAAEDLVQRQDEVDLASRLHERAAREHEQLRATHDAQEQLRRHQALLAEATALVREVLPELGPSVDLGSAAARVSEQVGELHRRRAADEARLALVAGHDRGLLADADCPICLRPLDEASVEAARQGHRAEAAALEARITEAASGLERALAAQSRLAQIAGRLGSAPAPADVPTEPVQGLEEARVAADTARDRLGHARATLESLGDQNRLFSTSLEWSRREALLRLVEGTAQALATEVAAQAVEPLAKVVAEQSSTLLPRDGIQVTEGRLVSAREAGELPYASLSGGEKARALLVHRVAALKTLTAAPMVVLDEPFGHLDPASRRRLGRLVLGLCESRAFTQTLVTTYEEELARDLATAHVSAPVSVLLLAEHRVGTGAA